MPQNNHIIIFSHGFGVKKDDRGLFSDIAHSLKDITPIMFDYNDIDDEKNQITVKAFSKQAEILKEKINSLKADNPEAIVDIICHSQGSIIAALVQPAGIRKIILIAPPSDASVERMIEAFKSRSGTEINLSGISKLSRRDGSVTIILPEYWEGRKNVQPLELYKQLAELTELTIINAKQDDVLGVNSFSDLDNVEIINIDGDHNFSGDDRKKLLEVVNGKIYT